jgi:aspartyl protease family protein
MIPTAFPRSALAVWFFVGALLGAPAFALPDGLREQLETLARERHFALEGLDELKAEQAKNIEGRIDTPAVLKLLLQDYNYLVTQSRPDRIEKVQITSRKKKISHAYVKTTRSGGHHWIEATLTGRHAAARTLSLLVDTGASTIVLPESMIQELGFGPEDLQDGVSRTASDTVPIRVGVLESVAVGRVSAGKVKVSFMADERLNGVMLLGMSFLERFRVTIDEANDRLMLMAK